MEIWKDIEGFEGRYQISNLGNVMSLNYKAHGYPALLTNKVNNQGYAWVELVKDGIRKPMLIHRLVAKAFIANPNNFPIINHKDENPLNNRVENLEWCNQSYNMRCAWELHPERRRQCKPYKCFKRVRQIDILSGKVIREYEYFTEIKRVLGKNEYSVRECCLGRRKTAYGYKWEFCE